MTATKDFDQGLDSELLFDLVETKLRLLAEMHSLSIEQSDLVATHDMSTLMSLLSKKQNLLDTLHGVQERLKLFAGQDPEQRIWSSPDRRMQCRQNLARSEQLVAELLVMENRSIDNMVLQRERVTGQLLQVADASRIAHAYEEPEIESQLDGESISFTG